MWEKIKNTAVIALATLGVLFIILMILPDDGEDVPENAAGTVTVQEEGGKGDADRTEGQEEGGTGADNEAEGQEENSAGADNGIDGQEEEKQSKEDEKESARKEDDSKKEGNKEEKDTGNAVEVDIPSSEISDVQLRFTTVTLDNKEVTQEIFSDYDITVVHVWGTFCQPCIEEMGDYAAFYKELPDNVNLIAVISDVYEGIDSNVSDADSILKDAGAKFVNLRISDDLYGITESLQYVPSSFFVDRSGHVVGNMMDGAGFDETKSRLDSYLK